MTDIGDTRTNLANTIRGFKKFDGSSSADFKAWMKLCRHRRHPQGHLTSAEGRRETDRYYQDCGLQQAK